MRLLVVPNNFPSPIRPSEGVFVLNQLKELRRLGFDISILRIVPSSLSVLRGWKVYRRIPNEYQVDGFQIQTLRAFQLPRNLGMEYQHHQLFESIAEQIRRYRPQIIHAHGLLPSGDLVAKHGVPTVVTAHGSDAYDLPWRRPGLTRAAKRAVLGASALTAVSGYVANQLHRMGASSVAVIFNGADASLFKSRPLERARAELGEPDAPSVVYVGHLMTEKGIYDLAKALEKLSDIRPRLLLVGDGPERNRLERNLAESGVNYKFFGALPHESLPILYQAASVVCLPSHREGLPAVICEAMLCGKVVVASRVGGIPEVVHDGETGYTVPAHDPLQLSFALREVLTNPAKRRTLEAAAKRFADSKLTWAANARAYEQIYRQLVP